MLRTIYCIEGHALLKRTVSQDFIDLKQYHLMLLIFFPKTISFNIIDLFPTIMHKQSYDTVSDKKGRRVAKHYFLFHSRVHGRRGGEGEGRGVNA